jgi:hypothetical protein
MILSSNEPIDVTNTRCYCGSPINKSLCDLCKPYSLEPFTDAVRLPKFHTENFPRAHTVVDLPGACAVVKSSPEPLRHHRVLLGAGDAVDQAGAIPKPTTLFPSPQQRRPPRARDAVHPHCSQAHDAVDPCHPWACSTVVLPEPAKPSLPRCPRAHDTVEPAPSLIPQWHHPPQACKATLYIFLCHFGPTNPDLICYIATLL